MHQLPGEIDRRKFFRAMARLGWFVISTRGSHFKLANAITGRKIIVAVHDVIRRKATLAALRQAGLTVEEFLEAL